MENLAHEAVVWTDLGEAYNYLESFKQPKVFFMKTLFLILLISATPLAFGQTKKVAVVKIVRGDVDVLSLGKTLKLKVDDWVEDGSVVKTADKSFAKLIFIDKSQMNIGPNSEMKIEKFSGNDSGVIDLVKGKIRSQVTKDYLQMNKDKSKLFIKTPNAVMGIRGTDFMISTNGKNTAAILFEGEVVFNKIETRGNVSTDKLEQMVDRGVRMHPGEFSVVERSRPEPTVPSLLNIEQRETLEKNDSFERAPSSAAGEEAKKSVVPEGLDGKAVSNDSGTLKTETPQTASANPDGYVAGDKVKPANGSFVHIESGIIIPPGKDSILDVNTNSYIPGPETGKVSADGSYLPPKNMEITADGKMMIAVVGANGSMKVIEVQPPSPVKLDISAPTIGTLAPAPLPTSGGGTTFISPNDPSNLNKSGGITTINEATQQINSGPKLRTINVNQ
jgi:hypothetical protein